VNPFSAISLEFFSSRLKKRVIFVWFDCDDDDDGDNEMMKISEYCWNVGTQQMCFVGCFTICSDGVGFDQNFEQFYPLNAVLIFPFIFGCWFCLPITCLTKSKGIDHN